LQCRIPTFEVELHFDENVSFLSLKDVEDGFQRLLRQHDTIPSLREQFFDDFWIGIGLDAGNEPAAIRVNTVEKLEIVETEIEQDECISHSLGSG